MSSTEGVTATVEVPVDPATAFEIFTEEIGRWWRPGPINWYDSTRAVDIRFEPGVGGRWLEVYDDEAGDVLEIGTVTVWEPGTRLALLYRDGGHELNGTEVEVRFEPVEGGTRVTLEHRGWDILPPDVARRAPAPRSVPVPGWWFPVPEPTAPRPHLPARPGGRPCPGGRFRRRWPPDRIPRHRR
jgi:hypothetical protein